MTSTDSNTARRRLTGFWLGLLPTLIAVGTLGTVLVALRMTSSLADERDLAMEQRDRAKVEFLVENAQLESIRFILKLSEQSVQASRQKLKDVQREIEQRSAIAVGLQVLLSDPSLSAACESELDAAGIASDLQQLIVPGPLAESSDPTGMYRERLSLILDAVEFQAKCGDYNSLIWRAVRNWPAMREFFGGLSKCGGDDEPVPHKLAEMVRVLVAEKAASADPFRRDSRYQEIRSRAHTLLWRHSYADDETTPKPRVISMQIPGQMEQSIDAYRARLRRVADYQRGPLLDALRKDARSAYFLARDGVANETRNRVACHSWVFYDLAGTECERAQYCKWAKCVCENQSSKHCD